MLYASWDCSKLEKMTMHVNNARRVPRHMSAKWRIILRSQVTLKEGETYIDPDTGQEFSEGDQISHEATVHPEPCRWLDVVDVINQHIKELFETSDKCSLQVFMLRRVRNGRK